ncbi:YeiH family protein [Lactiplantibacillus mudanjiangensis]|uniref:Integral membrane protein [Lactobacillus plantarum JDM1] n=1 Tax=Lactiplantibacillus mudanjiangensis TaxID=1296538 RepID=A0A660DVJ1_9LACO|nr:putative sulfate exporter family transporter [Lactiplantibacillus mudanjiangensis]VDG20037.1 integral membrane protein [Lactobacillus plantarum JDM1] [Lactiplantibacillus mudanjiangensis]VDG26198.1 integral membrane protein [Lactobacillus plantarum JDM1] [Lactiplantibacillus mudanjiangensis]VDG27354.1 integral membrane protein [Lactobacillus plantarum JDM1] [Lactiplantibacillus mudanjiangensis]VDG33434.1 integral membrane protein [Lactobacillus plantarum JDM1] [Lactiplantibacillus mudanjiang
MIQTMQRNLSGLIASLVIAVISQVVAIFIPTLGAATIAILIGIVLGNTILKQPGLAYGTKFAESKLLEYSVMLLGATMTFQTIGKIGGGGIVLILCQMTITIVGALWLGKKLGFGESKRLLMAGGNAVCGSSAIASIAPVIEADEDDKGMIITLVNLMGTVLMLTLPWLGMGLFGGNSILKGALIGGTLQSVGQVVAAASMVNQATVQYATIFKIMRIMMLVVVVLIFGRLHQRHLATEVAQDAQISGNGSGRWLPWYVAGFLILCVINSLVNLPPIVGTVAHVISSWFEIIALAAIGLRLNLAGFLKAGKKLVLYGLGVGTLQVVSVLILIVLLLNR